MIGYCIFQVNNSPTYFPYVLINFFIQNYTYQYILFLSKSYHNNLLHSLYTLPVSSVNYSPPHVYTYKFFHPKLYIPIYTKLLSKTYHNNLLCSISTLTVHQVNVNPLGMYVLPSKTPTYRYIIHCSRTGTPKWTLFYFFPLYHTPTVQPLSTKILHKFKKPTVYRTSKYTLHQKINVIFSIFFFPYRTSKYTVHQKIVTLIFFFHDSPTTLLFLTNKRKKIWWENLHVSFIFLHPVGNISHAMNNVP